MPKFKFFYQSKILGFSIAWPKLYIASSITSRRRIWAWGFFEDYLGYSTDPWLSKGLSLGPLCMEYQIPVKPLVRS